MEKTKVGAFIPLALVPTVLVGANVDGRPNYTTVGFVSGVNIKPPIIGVSLNRKHHTVKGILQNGCFSVNIPSADRMAETDYCGLVSGRSVDKSRVFTAFYGELGTAPMIEELPIVCECRYAGQKIDFAMDTVYFGEIVQAYVDSRLYKKGEPADILGINPLLTGLDGRYRLAGPPAGKIFSVGWDYLSKRRIGRDAPTGSGTAGVSGAGASEGSGGACGIVNRSPKPVLSIPCGARAEDIGRAVAELNRYAEECGGRPIEGPFVMRTAGLAPEAGIRVGFVFAAALPAAGRIEAGRIAGGRFARCLHAGPYDTLGTSLNALRAFIADAGFEASGAEYEFYRNDPATTTPEALETMILIPVKRAK
jgi:flavin reductase (DIM6/NTAB) family NADH-FMN oxidoreductase RutF/effector-binding domain-containing protein